MISGDVLVGTVVDNRYRLTKKIGRGSFGWVFEAIEEMAGQYVGRAAVKLLAPEDETQREMVLREIRALAGLTHEFIIAYRTSGQIADGPLIHTIFVVTELGEESLAQVLQARQRIPGGDVWAMGRGIASALVYIHGKGSVHRDVKPENILRVDGRWKLGDFGLARAVEGAQMSASGAKGTLRYMAPEVLNNEVTAASDVYALGVTLLRCLTGRYAHDGGTEGEFMANLMTKPPQVPLDLSNAWRAVLTGCLERDPSQRWNADQLAHQLEAGPAALVAPKPTVTVPGSPAVSTLPPLLDGGGIRNETVRIADQVGQWSRSLPVAHPEPEGRGGAETQSQSTASSSIESVAPLYQPPVELRIAEHEDVPAAHIRGETDTVFDGGVQRHRAHRTRSRFLRVAAFLALLVLGAAAYNWRAGPLHDLVQRVRSGVLEGLAPPTVPPRVVELTVLAAGPVVVRREPRLDAPSLGILMRDATVRTIGKSDDWYKVQMPTGGVAWIHQSAFLGGDSQSPEAKGPIGLAQPEVTESSRPEAEDGLIDSQRTDQFEQQSPQSAEPFGVSGSESGASDQLRRTPAGGRDERMGPRRAKLLRLKERCQRQPDRPVCRRLRRLSQ